MKNKLLNVYLSRLSSFFGSVSNDVSKTFNKKMDDDGNVFKIRTLLNNLVLAGRFQDIIFCFVHSNMKFEIWISCISVTA